MIQLILQPKGSNLCGQCVVAMLAGVSLERSIQAFSKRGLTNTSDLVRVLRHFGLTVPKSTLTRVTTSNPLPDRCVVSVVWTEPFLNNRMEIERRHWRIHWDGHTYDSCSGIDTPIHPEQARVTSFLEVRTRDLPVLASQSATQVLCEICPRPGHCCLKFNLHMNQLAGSKDLLDAQERLEDLGLPFEVLDYANPDDPFITDLLCSCPKLSSDGRCTIYETRPLTCRKFVPGSDPLCVLDGREGGIKSWPAGTYDRWWPK